MRSSETECLLSRNSILIIGQRYCGKCRGCLTGGLHELLRHNRSTSIQPCSKRLFFFRPIFLRPPFTQIPLVCQIEGEETPFDHALTQCHSFLIKFLQNFHTSIEHNVYFLLLTPAIYDFHLGLCQNFSDVFIF